MQRRTWEVATGIVVAFAIGAAGWWVALAKDDAPPAGAGQSATEAHLTPSLAPFTVSLTAVPSQAELDFGTHVALAAEAIAHEPLSRVELWQDDRLMSVQATSDPTGAPRIRGEFDWVAVSPGEHLLAARAIAVDGTQSWSRTWPVLVGLSTTSATGGAVAVPVEQGRPASEVAEQLGVDPASLVVDGSGATAAEQPEAPVGVAVQVLPPAVQGGTAGQIVPVADPLNTDTTVPDTTVPDTTVPDTTVPDTTVPVPDTTVPVPDTTVPDTTVPVPDTTTPSAPLAVGGFVAMVVVPISQYATLFPVLPQRPTLTVSLDGCSATVVRGGDSTVPATLHRSATGQSYVVDWHSFEKDATTYVDEQLMPGIYQYVLSTELDGNEFDSDPRTVVVPQSCASNSGWSGGFSITNGVLAVPKAGNGYYVYIGPPGATGSDWHRIPADDRAVINATSKHVIITPLIPTLGSWKELHAELWQRDSSGVAAKVADATLVVPPNQEPLHITGGGLTVDLTLTSGARSSVLKKNASVNFHWTAGWAVNRVVWQVTAKPLPRNDTSLAPPGLLATGLSITPDDYAGFGYFDFDSGKVPRTAPPEPDTSSGNPTSGGNAQLTLGTTAVQPPTLSTDGVPAYATPLGPDQPLLADPLSAKGADIEEIFGQIDTAAGVAVYVRGIPMIDEQVVGIATPTVVVVLPQQTATGPLTVQTVTFDPGQVPNPAWQRCGVVTVPWDEPGWSAPADVPADELNQLRTVYPTDGSYCRKDPAPADMSWDDELWALLEASGQQFVGFYDAAAAAYNSLATYAGELMADLNPICDALGGSAASACEDYSKAIAAIAVKAALQFLGLPPSLPTSSSLIASARATLELDIAAAAAEWMKAAGVPCEDWEQDPADYDKAIGAAASLGVSLQQATPGEDGKVDVCKALAKELLRRAIDKGQAAFNSQISQAMGGPGQSVPIPGFEISAHPAGRWNPQVVSVVAVPTDPGLDPSYVCQTTAYTSWVYYHEGSTKVALRHQPDGTWTGTAMFPTKPNAAADLETLYGDMDYFTVHSGFSPEVTVGNDACFGDAEVTATSTLTTHAADPVIP